MTIALAIFWWSIILLQMAYFFSVIFHLKRFNRSSLQRFQISESDRKKINEIADWCGLIDQNGEWID